MGKDKVRIGIVGSKFAADFHADCYRRLDNTELVAVAAVDNLKEFSKKWSIAETFDDYRDMLGKAEIDLVSICVPNFLHHDVALAAAEAGRHIVCEKPLATSVEDAEEMLRACEDKGVKLMYAEDWCFAPALMRVKQIVDEGAIGEVLYVKAKEVHNGTHSPFAKNAETCGGGCLIHLAIHPIGWLLHLIGNGGKNPVVEVIGKVNGGGEDNYVHKDNTGEDWAAGIVKFQNGVHALIEGNYITVGGMDDKVEIYGTEGRISADLTFGSPISVYSRPGYSYAIEKADNALGWTRPAIDEFYNLGYAGELEYFVNCVQKDEAPFWAVSGGAGLACLRIVRAMYQSSAEGGTVKGRW